MPWCTYSFKLHLQRSDGMAQCMALLYVCGGWLAWGEWEIFYQFIEWRNVSLESCVCVYTNHSMNMNETSAACMHAAT